jgi:hypothetical protein
MGRICRRWVWIGVGVSLMVIGCGAKRLKSAAKAGKPVDELAGVMRLHPKVICIHGQSGWVSSTELVFSQPVEAVIAAMPGSKFGSSGPVVTLKGKPIGSRFLWHTPMGKEIGIINWHGVKQHYFARPDGECELDLPGDLRS